MGIYGYRDNKLEIKEIEANIVELKKKAESKSVTYIKIPALTVGTVAPQTAYLFLGSAGKLCASSTAPVGTTGAFANKGLVIGTVI